MNSSSPSKITATLILLIILGIVLQGVLAVLIPLLPWLILAAVVGGIGFVAARVFVSRSKHF